MPFKTIMDPKTGKLKTYSITGRGRVWLEDGKLIPPGTPIPPAIKKAAENIKVEAAPPFGKRKRP